MEKLRCMIIASGNCDETLLKLCNSADYIIAADGGYDYLKKAAIRPDVVIGDFDSLSEDNKKELFVREDIKTVKLPCEKDDTDMLYCIKYAIDKGYKEIHLMGAIGDRPDHSYANIQCLSYMKDRRVKGIIHDLEYDIFMLQDETLILNNRKGAEISVFSYYKEVKKVSLTGFKYPLKEVAISSSYPLGISNEISEDEAEIAVENGRVLVFLKRS